MGKFFNMAFLSLFLSVASVMPVAASPSPLTQERATSGNGDGTSYQTAFDAVQGINTVPAAAGTYWYSISSDRECRFHVTSNEQLEGGRVSFYSSPYTIEYGAAPDYQSEIGSFELVAPAYAGNTYYFSISKGATVSDLRFVCALEDYPAGEIPGNPLVLTPPETVKVPCSAEADGNVRRYYAVDVPADTKASFLTLKSNLSSPQSPYSIFELKSDGSYYGESGTSFARIKIEPGTRYRIDAANYETKEVEFSVTFDEAVQGDFITDPIVAVKGENTLSGVGTKFFKFSATVTGKLLLTTTNAATEIGFPKSADPYSADYEFVKNGNAHILPVTAGTDYYIRVSNFADGEIFTIQNDVFQPGEDESTAIEVTDVYALGDKPEFVWLKYTAPKSGVLTISSDIDYSSENVVKYRKDTESGMNDVANSTFVDGSYVTVYETTTTVNAGTVVFVNILTVEAQPGSTVRFTLADPQPGQTLDNAISLEKDKEYDFEEVNYDSPMWCKITTKPGTVRLYATDYVSFTWYKSLNDAKGDNGGEWGSPNLEDEELGMSYYELTVANQGEVYVRLDRSYGPFKIHVTGDGVGTAGGDSHTNPLMATEGSNIVPSDKGTYWYRIDSPRDCRLKISSKNELTGGRVSFYLSEYSIEYGGTPDYQSVEGSFDLTAEVAAKTYYFSVSKAATTDDIKFDITFEDYAKGELENNPIVLTPPADSYAFSATGDDAKLTYYRVDVPVGSSFDFLTITVTNPEALVSGKTEFSITPEGSYYGTSGSDYVRVEVLPGKSYNITAYNYEADVINFTATLDDALQGDLISDPIEAVFGVNTVPAGGRVKYYKAVAGVSGKFELTPKAGVKVTFPKGVNTSDGNHEAVYVGGKYILPVTEGNEYIIRLDGVKNNDTFELLNSAFAPGEDKSTAELYTGPITLGDTPVYKWIKYVPEKSGILTISSDMVFEKDVVFKYVKEGEEVMTDIINTTYVDGDYVVKYEASLPVLSSDVVYVKLVVPESQPGSVITFNIADPTPGQILDSPIELKEGETYDFGEVTNDAPVWCKVAAMKGSFRIYASDYVSFDIYRSYEDAAGETNAEWGNPNMEDVEKNMSYYEVKVEDDCDCYIKLTRSYGPVTIFITCDYIGTVGITNAYSYDPAQPVDIYTVDGRLVAKDVHLENAHLSSGVYVYKQGNVSKKVLVK